MRMKQWQERPWPSFKVRNSGGSMHRRAICSFSECTFAHQSGITGSSCILVQYVFVALLGAVPGSISPLKNQVFMYWRKPHPHIGPTFDLLHDDVVPQDSSGKNPILKVQWTRTNIDGDNNGMFSIEAPFAPTLSLRTCHIIIYHAFGSVVGFLPFRWRVNPHLLFLSRVSYIKKAASTSQQDMCLFNETPTDLQRCEHLFFMEWERVKGKGGERLCTWLKLLSFFH